MGFSFNQATLIGRLTKDPETKNTTELACSTFALAVDRNYKKEDGTKDTDFINIKAFGKMADVSTKYLTKGRAILVVGRIQVHSYEKDNERKWFTEVIADKIEFLSFPTKDSAEAKIAKTA
jgi:single-strand DNA-binding protein